MINEAHSILNKILGLNEITNINNKCTLSIVVSDSELVVKLFDSSNNLVKIIKSNSNITNSISYDYNLDVGDYYLKCYKKDKELLTQVYYETITVFDTMLNTVKVIEVSI